MDAVMMLVIAAAVRMHFSKVQKLEDKVSKAMPYKDVQAYVEKRIDEKLELLNYRLADVTEALRDLKSAIEKIKDGHG